MVTADQSMAIQSDGKDVNQQPPSSDTLFLYTGNLMDKDLQFLNKYSTEVLCTVCQLFQKVQYILTIHDAEWYLKLGPDSVRQHPSQFLY
jgi:hypothetical protein